MLHEWSIGKNDYVYNYCSLLDKVVRLIHVFFMSRLSLTMVDTLQWSITIKPIYVAKTSWSGLGSIIMVITVVTELL